MSLVVLRPSVSVSSASSPSAGSDSRVTHTSRPQSRPERQCCSPAGGRISALTLYKVWQHQDVVTRLWPCLCSGRLNETRHAFGLPVYVQERLHACEREQREDLRWLCRDGTGSERVWRQRSPGWAARRWQRRRTGGRGAGRPSTSPPTSRTHCAYCTKATHRTHHTWSSPTDQRRREWYLLRWSSAHLLWFSVEGLELQRRVLLLCQRHFGQHEVHIGHILHTHLDVLPAGVRSQICMIEHIILLSYIIFSAKRHFPWNTDSPVTSRKQRVFGLEGDVEREGKQSGVDRPRTVDGHLWTGRQQILM